jgi:cytochrome P450
MQTLDLSPRDPQFVQNPYAAYDAARRRGPVLYWKQYGMAAVFDAASVRALLRDKRLGRAAPAGAETDTPDHLAAFQAVEAHSMLELEPPRHTRLRGLVLRAFTSRRIAGLGPDITAVADELITALPRHTPFDLVAAYCTELPVRIIARLLGVPEDIAPDLLRWSHDMVAMYQARRGREIEHRANAAAAEFTAFLRDYIEHRRDRPGDDLISHLIAAREEDGARL